MKITAYKQDVGQEYNNEFKNNNIYPWNEIGRVLMDTTTGEIVKELSETNSNLGKDGKASGFDETKHDIMVKFPVFYSKRTWVGNTSTDSILSVVPSTPTRLDYSVPQCFIRDDGSVMPYVLVAMCEGSVLESEPTILRSIPNKKPQVNKSQSQFRTMAREGRNAEKFGILDFETLTMVQNLYKCSFGTTNAQSAIGNGWTKKTKSCTAGVTMELGNRSGYLGVNGEAISVFGIENFYGSCWKNIDGFLVEDNGYYIAQKSTDYGDKSKMKFYPSNNVVVGAEVDTYQEYYFKNVDKIGSYNTPISSGGSPTTCYSDYFLSHKKTQSNILIFGCDWNDGALAGAFSFFLYHVVSVSDSGVASLLCVKS